MLILNELSSQCAPGKSERSPQSGGSSGIGLWNGGVGIFTQESQRTATGPLLRGVEL